MERMNGPHVEYYDGDFHHSTQNGRAKLHSPTFVEQELSEPHIHLKTLLVVLAVNCTYFAQVVNVVGAGAFATDIAAVVGGSASTVWLVSVVTILTVVLGPPISQAADYWGRKWFLVCLTACGFIGSMIVSRATSMPMAIAGEVVAGFSYGAQPLLHAVSSEVLPRKWRPHAQASINVAASMGGLTGLLVGGALTRNDHAEGFRIYWYMAAAFFAVAAVICVTLYNPPPRDLQMSLSLSEKLRKLDWNGYFLLTTGLVLFCVGLSWAENPYPWTSPRVLATFLVGVGLSIGLVLYETFLKKDGMFHHGLFSRGRNFPIAVGCVFVEGLVFFAANNYFAFETSVLFETDGLLVTLRYGITFIVYGITSVFVGLYCSKTKKLRLPTILAFLNFIIFNITMATTSKDNSTNTWGYTVFLGIGLGCCLCTLVTVAQLSTPPELISVASGLMIAIRSLGGSVGLAIYNSIFNSQLTSNLGNNIAEAAMSQGLPATSVGELITALSAQDTTAVAAVPGVTPSIIEAALNALQSTYLVAFRHIWVAAGCFTVVALIASCFLIDPKSDFNSRIDAPMETPEELSKV